MNDDPLPLQGEPRSQVWRWLLGSSSTLSTGLIVSLVTGLILATFGSSRVSDVLSGAFQVPFWIILLSSLGFVGYRIGSGIRNRRRFDRELELTEGLIAPPEACDLPAAEGPGTQTASVRQSDRAAWFLHCIDQIRHYEYDIDALLAVYSAMESAPHRIPEARPAGRGNFRLLIKELVADGYLRVVAVNRVARDLDMPAPSVTGPAGAALRPGSHAWDTGIAVALPAFLQHHADLATRWAAALNTTRLAEGAVRWFRVNHEALADLVQSVDNPRTAVVVELSRILDALETWYAHCGQPDVFVPLAKHVLGLAERGEPVAPVLTRLTAIRGNSFLRAPDSMRPRKFEAALQARADHHIALAHLNRRLAGDRHTRTLERLEDQLEKVWWKLAPDDVGGDVCALVNLAIIHLEQGRLEAAQDRLELADSLTRTGRDPSGRAHALEISGLLCWAQGTPRRSVDHWLRALSLYRKLKEQEGVARCLRHLATAVLHAPKDAGHVLAGKPAAVVAQHAGGWRRHGATYADSDDGCWPDHADPYPTQSEPWRGWLRPFRR